MRKGFIVIVVIMMCVLVLAAINTYGADSTVNYKNQPPPSAISPSVQSYSQMICSFPVVGAVSTTVVGISTGTTFTDWDCERRALAQVLSKSGLKVASISILCAGSEEVWSAMLHSGTPCSIWNGKKALIGKEAIEYYKIKGYIDNDGKILKFPDYVRTYPKPNFSESNRNSKSKYPK
mgnify:CR=1 FL=1